MTPAVVVPSPQVIVAAKLSCVAAGLAELKVAVWTSVAYTPSIVEKLTAAPGTGGAAAALLMVICSKFA